MLSSDTRFLFRLPKSEQNLKVSSCHPPCTGSRKDMQLCKSRSQCEQCKTYRCFQCQGWPRSGVRNSAEISQHLEMPGVLELLWNSQHPVYPLYSILQQTVPWALLLMGNLTALRSALLSFKQLLISRTEARLGSGLLHASTCSLGCFLFLAALAWAARRTGVAKLADITGSCLVFSEMAYF